MITEHMGYPAAGSTRYVELFCLSSDAKPTANIANGSIAVEIDTGKVYFYNQAGGAWVEQFSFQ